MRERDLHDAFEAWLRKHDIPFSHERMDRKTTGKVGDVDFRVYGPGNHVAMIEFKTAGGRLSDEQNARKAHLERSGCQVCIARDLETAIYHLATIFSPELAEPEPPPAAPPEPKFYLVNSSVGLVVIKENGKDVEVVRAATPEDVERIPPRPIG